METDRRNFLATLVGGIAGMAAVRTWPFRVYSFPSGIQTPTEHEVLGMWAADVMRRFAVTLDRTALQIYSIPMPGSMLPIRTLRPSPEHLLIRGYGRDFI